MFATFEPSKIEVSVKKVAVPVIIASKEAFDVVHGTLPNSLKAMPVRIQVKVIGKSKKCNAEGGWLLKIVP